MISKISDAVDLVQKGLNVAADLKSADAKLALADAKMALAEIRINYAELMEENRRLKDAAKMREDISYSKDGAVVLGGERFCAGCYGMKEKLVHLRPTRNGGGSCPSCKASYSQGSSNTPSAYGGWSPFCQ